GLDIAKSVFQIHGVDADGTVVIRTRVSRSKVLQFFADLSPCLVGIEACPTAHHWSRQLQLLGHTVRLMPPSYVKAYLKRAKRCALSCWRVQRPQPWSACARSTGSATAALRCRASARSGSRPSRLQPGRDLQGRGFWNCADFASGHTISGQLLQE